jgi:exosome complex component MTR3
MFRADGRASSSLRPVSIVVGGSVSARGSALLSLGRTRALATVHGPRENTHASGETVSSGAFDVRVTIAAFASRARRGAAAGTLGDEERRLEGALRAALLPAVLLERFPKAVVELHVLFLEIDGGEVAAAVMAASAALTDAGVDVIDCVAAGSVCFSRSGELLVDPTEAELAAGAGSCTLAILPSLGTITSASHAGDAGTDDVLRGIALAVDAASTAHGALRPALASAASRRLAAV